VTTTAAPRLFADRFEVDRLAGSGGMGAVYRARDRATGAVVALKLTHHGVAEPEAAARFEREARLLAEIAHSGIVSYVAHGETPGSEARRDDVEEGAVTRGAPLRSPGRPRDRPRCSGRGVDVGLHGSAPARGALSTVSLVR
jgi:serine/threonine protein kinase